MIVPSGFRLGAAASGIKANGNDLGLIVADSDCVAAGVYTNNLVRASCIDQNRGKTPTGKLRCVVVNSGNANACTGDEGESNSMAMANSVAQKIGCNPDQVLVLSTGVIGQQLPMNKINAGINSAHGALDNSPESIPKLAQAFMTTDKFQKTVSRQFQIRGTDCQLLGIAKGAGMIGPNMATMLGVFMLDATLNPNQAQTILTAAVNESFNRISVDGHTSTNDAVLLLASGTSVDPVSDEDLNFIQDVVTQCSIDLAKMIPTDGEGASHLIEIQVSGAASDAAADRVARVVASSNLVKTAISGCDPNWGRIVSAVGMANIELDPQAISLKLNGTTIFSTGSPVTFNEAAVSQSMVDEKVALIELTIGGGGGSAVHWTSDLTHEYVTLNADYRT